MLTTVRVTPHAAILFLYFPHSILNRDIFKQAYQFHLRSFRKRTETTFSLSSFEPTSAIPLTFAKGSVASSSLEDHWEVKHNRGERPSCLR